jgi:hypothetical protein
VSSNIDTGQTLSAKSLYFISNFASPFFPIFSISLDAQIEKLIGLKIENNIDLNSKSKEYI